MSLLDDVINAVTGTGASGWTAANGSKSVTPDDPQVLSANWVARRQAEEAARAKGTFETSNEYRARLAAIETSARKPTIATRRVLVPQCERANYDADSTSCSINTRPMALTLASQLYNRLPLRAEVKSEGEYRLTNVFGASVGGKYLTTTTYVFEIANFRALSGLRRQIRSGPYTHDEVLGASFPLERDLARSVLQHLQLSVRVRLDDVHFDSGYSYGGDDIAVPDTHRKSWMVLRGAVEGVDVIDAQTLQVLGGWNVA